MFAHVYRTFLALLTAALFTLSAVAQETPLAAPRAISTPGDSFNNGSPIRINMPDAGDGINISAYTMEASEPGASCVSGPLSHSAWFEIIHPGGTLDINTAFSTGSGFDSVAQLFADDTGVVAALNEIACDNDSGGGSSNNDARLLIPNLASGRYIARITCIALCGGTTDLALSVVYSPNLPQPPNDQVSTPKPIQIGKAGLTLNAEHATVAATENSTLSCDMYYSVWYRMIVPYAGAYSFSSFGSVLNRLEQNPADTKLAVYVSSSGPIFTNFTERGCSDDYGGTIGYGAVPALLFNAGDEVYVQVGTFSAANMLAGSYYRVKTTVVSLPNVLLNESFETGTLAPWTMKVTSGLDGVTNTYDQVGDYSARMTGEPGKVNKLKQKWSLDGIKLVKDSMVVANFSYSTNGTVSNNATGVLKMTFTDNTPAKTAKIKLNKQTAAGSFNTVYLQLPVKPAKVKAITLMINNKSSGGVLFIDSAVLRIHGDPTRATGQPLDLLPVPDAPPLTLRGAN